VGPEKEKIYLKMMIVESNKFWKGTCIEFKIVECRKVRDGYFLICWLKFTLMDGEIEAIISHKFACDDSEEPIPVKVGTIFPPTLTASIHNYLRASIPESF